jgi:hypothetical protein
MIIEAQSEGEILNPIPILLRIACFPDEHQVLDDLAKGISATKQKDPWHMAASLKMLA